jgi:hypothetical protein
MMTLLTSDVAPAVDIDRSVCLITLPLGELQTG